MFGSAGASPFRRFPFCSFHAFVIKIVASRYRNHYTRKQFANYESATFASKRAETRESGCLLVAMTIACRHDRLMMYR
jgi:hypothetical protein